MDTLPSDSQDPQESQDLDELRSRLLMIEGLVDQVFNLDLRVRNVKRVLSPQEEVSVLLHMLIKRVMFFEVEREDFLNTLAMNFDDYKAIHQERDGRTFAPGPGTMR